jgi:N-formylglutamate deformylase
LVLTTGSTSIHTYYQPYHDKLAQLLDQTAKQFGRAYLLDLHSFFGPTSIDCQVDLGNRRNQTCSARMIDCFERAFQSEGYDARQNRYYAGGHILQHYANKSTIETLQIEVRYTLYLANDQLDKTQPPQSNVQELPAARVRFERIYKAAIHELCSVIQEN